MDIAIREESGREDKEAKCVGRVVEGRTASISYLARASDKESGRPDHMTESGLTGGMKRVRVEVGMS